MISRFRRVSRLLVLAALALPAGSGCTDLNSGKDDQTGRGKGDQLPATGNASKGTTTGIEVNTEGPGSPVVGQPLGGTPTQSTPYGGGGAGVAPPVTPSKGDGGSGESNSGQKTGEAAQAGKNQPSGTAKPGADNGGPGTGVPPR